MSNIVKEQMKTQYQAVAKKFNALSVRERLIITAATVVCVYMIWSTYVRDTILEINDQLQQQGQSIRDQLARLGAQIDTISELIGRNPTSTLYTQLKGLKNENEELDKKAVTLVGTMISPKDMNSVVREVISTAEGLTVQSITSLNTVLLFEETGKSAEAKAKENKPTIKIFKHGLQAQLTGNYFDTMKFLKTLEGKNIKVIWDEFDYQVSEYPIAKISLIIHTLSLQEGWIGV